MSDDKKLLITDEEFDEEIQKLFGYSDEKLLAMAEKMEKSKWYKGLPDEAPEGEIEAIIKAIKNIECVDDNEIVDPREDCEKKPSVDNTIYKMTEYKIANSENSSNRVLDITKEFSERNTANNKEVVNTEVNKEVSETSIALDTIIDNCNVVRVPRITWKRIRMLVIVAAIFGTWFVAGNTSIGNKSFVFRQDDRENNNYGIVLNNNENKSGIGAEEEAYALIEKEIGIDALKIYDRPEGMNFTEVKIAGSNSTLYYNIGEQVIFLRETIASTEASLSADTDSKEIASVYNNSLDQEIGIRQESTNDGIKYSSIVLMNNAFYIISGIIDLEEYKIIVADLGF